MANKGKIFEKEFKNSAQSQEVFIVRFNDTDMSFNQEKRSVNRFTPKSLCDFFCYEYPYLYFLEMKSTRYKSISFQRNEDDDGMIQMHQINSLVQLSQHKGAFAGFVFNFRVEDEDKPYSETTYYMSIDNFTKFFVSTDKKSINALDIVQNGGFLIKAQQKRKLYVYDVRYMLEGITNQIEKGVLGNGSIQQDF